MIRQLLFAAFACTTLTACGGGCRNEVIQTMGSPDKTLKAVLFKRDCGATTDFTSQLSIIAERNELSNEGGNAFVVDTDHGKTKDTPWHGPGLEIHWISNHELDVRYDHHARVFKKENSAGGANISYRADL